MIKRNFNKNRNFTGLLLFLGFMAAGCGGAGKNMTDSPQYLELLEEIADAEFEIENERANPSQYSRVNLIGNPNRIKFENDSVNVFLPFFGERYSGGGYNSDGGAIQFKGVPQDLQIRENPEKGSVHISFEGNKETENLEFFLTIYSNGVARTSVTSSQRAHISYDGNLINRE